MAGRRNGMANSPIPFNQRMRISGSTMTEPITFDGPNLDHIADNASLRRVRFVPQANDDDSVLLAFADPSPHQALISSARLNGSLRKAAEPLRDAIEILTVPIPP